MHLGNFFLFSPKADDKEKRSAFGAFIFLEIFGVEKKMMYKGKQKEEKMSHEINYACKEKQYANV